MQGNYKLPDSDHLLAYMYICSSTDGVLLWPSGPSLLLSTRLNLYIFAYATMHMHTLHTCTYICTCSYGSCIILRGSVN